MVRRPTVLTPAVEEAKRAALEIAEGLQRRVTPPAPWVAVPQNFQKYSLRDLQYGLATVWELRDGRGRAVVDFSVWVDRNAVSSRHHDPILCAAFGADGPHAAMLERLARSENILPRKYGYEHRSRVQGFYGDAVLDLQSNKARYVSSYRPSCALAVEPAIVAFASFFEQWRRVAQRIGALCRGKVVFAPDPSLAVVRGLLGELKVLSLPGFESARWLGAGREAHDIELRDAYVEVKTSAIESFQLSYQQITAAADPFFLAPVDVNEDALITLSAPSSTKRTHDVVTRHKRHIEKYVRARGLPFSPELLRRLSAALPDCTVKFYRLREPDGWREAVHALERFGRFGQLRQQCARTEWFTEAAPPG